MKLFIAPSDPTGADGRRLIAGSQADLLAVFGPDEVFTLSSEELAATAGMTFYIAHAGQALGCVASLDCGDYAEVKRLYVAPEGRGKGIARALMERLEADAAALGKSHIRLETGPPLVAAIRLYADLGYRLRGPFGDYADHPSSLFMEKAL